MSSLKGLVDWEEDKDGNKVLDCWDVECLSEKCIKSGKRCIMKVERKEEEDE